jgi:L-ribulose-5-phosphate 3-epimerase
MAPIQSPALSRRRFVGQLATATTLAWLVPGVRAPAAEPDATPASAGQRYRIAVCDWMLLKRQKLGAFALAQEIGADGVEVDMGGLGDRPTFDSALGDVGVRRQFLEKAREFGLGVSSLAMSGFYAQSFAERPGVERMVQDCLDTMVAMSVKVAFLPLGVQGDLVKRPELRPAIVARLKSVAGRAEAAGVIVGIETALDARGEAALLDEVGSPAVRSYFNFANALQNGRDLNAEIRTLGKNRICQIHCTDEDGVWLQNNPRLDLPAVKATLDAIGWGGWLVVERSRDAKDPRNVRKNFGANVAHLKTIFQPRAAGAEASAAR